ncbi:ImuA family protein [Anatilimnocola floriformis]|uniref:ImuA family protein n=1 Tax=Anatilimnocola floriformis TaxID=2948575 RepID=UPI0020C4844E|nr:hypothetical protein [Anatilimnocola floriformis]
MRSAQVNLAKAIQAQLPGETTYHVDRLATGSAALDAILAGGIRWGTLVEWLGEDGCGATSLALAVAQQACQDGQSLVVIDPRRRFYPPAAENILSKTIVTWPATDSDQEWTALQALRSPAIGAVLWWPEKLTERTFRRLQLAAESGRSLGLLVRSAAVIGKPSWAELRLLVRSLAAETGRRFQVEVVRYRGASGRSMEVEINSKGLIHDAHSVHSISELAATATAGHASSTQTPRRRRV